MKFDLATKRIEEMDDRQLLELILINQITIYQKLDRFNTYALKKLGAELAQEGEHKDQSYQSLLDHAADFCLQYNKLKSDGEI